MNAIAANSIVPLSWYLVRTKPAAETVATEHLERQGFRVYFPRLMTSIRQRGRVVAGVKPLFPRYLFVGLQAGIQSLGTVSFTRGVSGLVKFGWELAAVPARVIEQLRLRADPANGLHKLDISRLCAGIGVRVVSGTFEGLEGVFQRECGEQRVIVLLDLLGQGARVCLQAGDIEINERTRARPADQAARQSC